MSTHKIAMEERLWMIRMLDILIRLDILHNDDMAGIIDDDWYITI